MNRFSISQSAVLVFHRFSRVVTDDISNSSNNVAQEVLSCAYGFTVFAGRAIESMTHQRTERQIYRATERPSREVKNISDEPCCVVVIRFCHDVDRL
ncbi:MAG: hypothetical protein RMM98_11735 [Acidobacteriota bacterium]|nr:hypothetical protein [Blastocatellia bacterium]MDW8240279.1 hypothetical protein [Acidobacteriota bacterium]